MNRELQDFTIFKVNSAKQKKNHRGCPVRNNGISTGKGLIVDVQIVSPPLHKICLLFLLFHSQQESILHLVLSAREEIQEKKEPQSY